MQTQAATRRIDLDWLRVGAFALLIFYHIGMFYVTWDWHVKSRHASSALEPLMLALSPWRLPLLFFISGVALAHVAARVSPAVFARERWHRLFWPLLFGVLVIVPPQAYGEIVEKISYDGRYFRDFYPLYLTAYGGWCRGDDCLIVPTWNHLWFVAYLLAYSLLLAAGLALARRWGRHLRLMPSLLLFCVGPWLWWWACRFVLLPQFDITHALVNDLYGHALYLPIFLFGYLVAFRGDLFAAAERGRWLALAVAVAAYAARLAVNALPDDDASVPDWLALGLNPLQAWSSILALLGFAARHLANRDSPALRWLSRAVFPCYIAHQTLIVILGPALEATALPLAGQAAALVAATLGGSLAIAWLAMQVPGLGVVLGVRHQPSDAHRK